MACRKMGRPTDFHGLDLIPDEKLVLLTLGNADGLPGHSLQSGEAVPRSAYCEASSLYT